MSRRVRLFSGDFDLQVQISWRISFFDFFCSVQSIELVVLKYFSGAESSREFAELICVVNKIATILQKCRKLQIRPIRGTHGTPVTLWEYSNS